jgi:hypothetical protein
VPAVGNEDENVAREASAPELKAPLSLVTVCVIESSFVHVTVAPTDTMMGFGLKAALPRICAPDGIVTAFPLVGLGLGAGVVGVGEVGVDELLLPHAATKSSTATGNTKRKILIDISIDTKR